MKIFGRKIQLVWWGWRWAWGWCGWPRQWKSPMFIGIFVCPIEIRIWSKTPDCIGRDISQLLKGD